MLAGLSALPLTPFRENTVDEGAFAMVIDRLSRSGVDSITALGSTGSFAYLTTGERARAARVAVEHAAGTPVVVGVSAMRTSQVLANVESAQLAGAMGLQLAPMTDHPLSQDEVFGLFRTVSNATDVPVIVYDDPNMTHFTFAGSLYARIAELPMISAIKIRGVLKDPVAARRHIEAIRAVLPEHVTIGVSSDVSAAAGLNAGCDAWYSVLGGTLPEVALAITRAAQEGRSSEATAQSKRLAPLWSLFAELGSIRVMAAIAEQLSILPADCLPLPILPLPDEEWTRVSRVVRQLELR
jgi:4-hydroxy-tetrahydrodipicolinate synthase